MLDSEIDVKYPRTLARLRSRISSFIAKWTLGVSIDIQDEINHVSQALTNRIRQLAERYETPLPELTKKVAELMMRVEGHLRLIGATW